MGSRRRAHVDARQTKAGCQSAYFLVRLLRSQGSYRSELARQISCSQMRLSSSMAQKIFMELADPRWVWLRLDERVRNCARTHIRLAYLVATVAQLDARFASLRTASLMAKTRKFHGERAAFISHIRTAFSRLSYLSTLSALSCLLPLLSYKRGSSQSGQSSLIGSRLA